LARFPTLEETKNARRKEKFSKQQKAEDFSVYGKQSRRQAGEKGIFQQLTNHWE